METGGTLCRKTKKARANEEILGERKKIDHKEYI